jgi:hypothetical protein
VARRKVHALRRMPPGVAGVSLGASVEGAKKDTAPGKPELRMVAKDPSWRDAPVEEVLLVATLVEEGSGTGMPDLLAEVEAQAAPPPHQADVSSTRRTNEEMVQEEQPPREVVAVDPEEALAVGGKAAGAVLGGWCRRWCPPPWR